jgi:hypothetical protein
MSLSELKVYVVMQSCLKKQSHDIHSLQTILSTSTPAVMSPPTPAPTPVPVAVSPQAALADDNIKQQMVASLAAQSGMNLSWSKK